MLKQIKGYFSKYLTLNYERIILIEFSMVENGLSNHVLFFPLRWIADDNSACNNNVVQESQVDRNRTKIQRLASSR